MTVIDLAKNHLCCRVDLHRRKSPIAQQIQLGECETEKMPDTNYITVANSTH